MHSRPLHLLLAITLLLASCHQSDRPILLNGEAQGTYYNIAYFDPQQRNLQQQVDSLLHAFDQIASLWVENSTIRQINSHSDSLVGPIFLDILNKSNEIEAYTNGAFNCRIGPLVNLYGFGFKNRTDVTDSQVDSLLAILRANGPAVADTHAGSANGILRLPPGVELDFNAIAQGYSVDLIAHLFDSLGLTSYLINVGGEVIAHGAKPDGSSWKVGIERPAADKYSSQEIETAIALNDCSVVTSGSYRKYYEQDGLRYSHTIDPATGRPVSHNLLSASVVSRQSWYADAMATAFMVMGLDNALQFIESHPDNPDIQAAFFIYDDHGTYKTYATPQFQQLINKD